MTEALRVVIAAEGGFGAQTAAAVLAEAAYESDKEALYIPNFGVEQRGGVSVAFLQIGDAVPALDYARRECGGRGGNLVMAGLIVALTEIVPVEAVRSVLKRRYGSGAMADANLKALRFGLGYDGGDIE